MNKQYTHPLTFIFICLAISLFQVERTFAQIAPTITIDRDEAWVDFPEAIDFRLVGQSDQLIEAVTLEYGLDALACGEVTSQIIQTFEPTTELDVSLRWQVVPDQIIPPHGRFWWRWVLHTIDGQKIELEQQDAPFEDDWFVWRELTQDNVTMHWYRGTEEFAQEILTAAIEARDQLAAETGLLITEPIQAYLYEEGRDFAISLPGAPAWAGGVAFPDHNIVMVVTNRDSLEYGVRTMKHEVGHLVIGQLTFNCFQNLPTWLNEGLAQVAEGAMEARNINNVADAVTEEKLPSLGQLEGSFSVHGDRASLSYAVGESFTRYLIEQYGADRMGDYLLTIKDGIGWDDAFEQIYGRPMIELENEWRSELGASSLAAITADQPTAVPTLSLAIVHTATETPEPTVSPTVAPTQPPTAVPTVAATAIPMLEASPENIDSVTNGPGNVSFGWQILSGVIILLLIMIGLIIYIRKRK